MTAPPSTSTDGPTSTWPWSAVTTSTAPGGRTLEQVGHQPVGRPQLGLVVRAEAHGHGDTRSMPS